MNYVQAYISNVSYPTTLNEVYNFAHLFNVEQLLGCGYDNMLDDNDTVDFYDTDKYTSRSTEWTAPKWCKKGDIVFFMHAKTAKSKISSLKTELLHNRDDYTENEFWILANALIRSKKVYDTYGGKIFAVGRISGIPAYDKTFNNTDYHWKSSIFAPIESIFLLENPIDISEFNDEIMVSRQSSITPVLGEQFDFLKELILKKNSLVEDYLTNAEAEPMPLRNLNDENWLKIVNQHRRSFFLEIQFRSFYTDRFLKILGDTKTFYRECACDKQGQARTFADNVILLDRKYLPVEIKLLVSAEKNIISQLSTYCHQDKIILNKEKSASSDVYQNNVLVIDTESVYVFYDYEQKIKKIIELDTINSNSDILKLREKIIAVLSE